MAKFKIFRKVTEIFDDQLYDAEEKTHEYSKFEKTLNDFIKDKKIIDTQYKTDSIRIKSNEVLSDEAPSFEYIESIMIIYEDK